MATLLRLSVPDTTTLVTLDDHWWSVDSFTRNRSNRQATIPTVGGFAVQPLGPNPTALVLSGALAVAGKANVGAVPPATSSGNWYTQSGLDDLDDLVGQVVDLRMSIEYGRYYFEALDYDHAAILQGLTRVAPQFVTWRMRFIEIEETFRAVAVG